jgi:hypothetical protein
VTATEKNESGRAFNGGSRSPEVLHCISRQPMVNWVIG